ncbi:unnamed protein product [Lactuca virosa]|uniref:Uncharacterized protein n=1 Tax=Lactuca virosa TaxID=75947 RepID=A0AAU9ML82_9ASTR|nr:unnamed protein product [Lactuca virosa]
MDMPLKHQIGLKQVDLWLSPWPDPMLVLEFSMHVLESCPSQTIDLFLTGNIPADLVNSYLKQHAPKMQAMYLELMLSMNENGISGNLQNENGVLEAIRISCAGYPTNKAFADFVKQFGLLVPEVLRSNSIVAIDPSRPRSRSRSLRVVSFIVMYNPC